MLIAEKRQSGEEGDHVRVRCRAIERVKCASRAGDTWNSEVVVGDNDGSDELGIVQLSGTTGWTRQEREVRDAGEG